jgi:hypothetical protein
LKVSGSQVSPTEIEATIVAHPGNLITDVTVAGVSGGRTSDEKIPRAWVVLSATGKQRGEATTRKELIAWTEKNLARYKWLRGGIEFVPEVSMIFSWRLVQVVNHTRQHRFQNLRLGKSSDEFCRTSTKRKSPDLPNYRRTVACILLMLEQHRMMFNLKGLLHLDPETPRCQSRFTEFIYTYLY